MVKSKVRSRFENKLLLFSLGVFLVLGWQVFNSLYQDSPNVQSSQVDNALRSQLREPSSIEPSKGEVSKILQDQKSSYFSFDLNCRMKSPLNQVVQGGYIQISGKKCFKKKIKTVEMKITNSTNGFTATIFEPEENQYQTDMIQLNKGMNHIQLAYKLSNGESFEKVLDLDSE